MKITIALLLYFGLHSLLANQQVKGYLQQKWIAAHWYRIAYNGVALITLLPIYYWGFKVEEGYLFQVPIYLKGVALAGLGLGGLLLLIALRQYDLGEFSGFSQLKQQQKEVHQQLQTTGFNSYVRHPIYFASLLLFWFYFLAFPTKTALIIAIISSIYLYVGASLEEKKLLLTFGKSYQRYQQVVPMLLPTLKRNHNRTKP